MKIIAEFNSVEELLNFTNTFGAKTFVPKVEENQQVEKDVVTAEASKKEIKRAETDKYYYHPESDSYLKLPKGEEIPSDKDFALCDEITKEEYISGLKKQQEESKESQITFDMVKDICSKALKAQKSSDVKAIVAKYGAKKISDLKEENYKAVYEEVGGLL